MAIVELETFGRPSGRVRAHAAHNPRETAHNPRETAHNPREIAHNPRNTGYNSSAGPKNQGTTTRPVPKSFGAGVSDQL